MAANANAAVSIRNCLPHPLPVYGYSGGKHTPSAGGETTLNTVPPRFAIERRMAQAGSNVVRWVTVGQSFLNSGNQVGRTWDIITARNAVLQMLADPATSQSVRNRLGPDRDHVDNFLHDAQFVPEKEENIRHGNEADVVRTANLYLVHPVIQALCSHPAYRDCLVSKAEDTKNGTRTDITFLRAWAVGIDRSFAILEFKRRGAIQGDQFRHNGPLPPSNLLEVPVGQLPTAQQVAAVRNIPAAVLQNNSTPTQFQHGALILIKQATAYSIEHRTRYVALYNYDFMILCYFPWLDTSKDTRTLQAMNQASGGEFPVEVDIYDRTNPAEFAAMRLSLLGFMWTAIEATR